jgi:hypothetical protein
VHEIQNDLHFISTGVDLLHLAQATPRDYRAIVNRLERTNKLLQELHQHFFHPRRNVPRRTRQSSWKR